MKHATLTVILPFYTLTHLLTSIFAIYLCVCVYVSGSVAANDKKSKKGSRGKKGRLTEAEEDEQLLKSAQSKRRVIRLDTQPSCLAPICKMHDYQLEGLNWLIKLHCNGINGILADEVSNYSTCCCIIIMLCLASLGFLTPTFYLACVDFLERWGE
jgi:SNF2 family DNA or RNA helicase